MKIQLNRHNFILYRQAIKQFEGVTIEESNDAYFIDGLETDYYHFRNNYYFMLGDNRHRSKDSRYRGFVAEQCIIGKAILVLFSSWDGKFKWDRALLRIR